MIAQNHSTIERPALSPSALADRTPASYCTRPAHSSALDLADRCRALVAGGRPAYTPRTVSTVTRFSTGAEVYTNRRGRCEDAPCCGCCS